MTSEASVRNQEWGPSGLGACFLKKKILGTILTQGWGNAEGSLERDKRKCFLLVGKRDMSYFMELTLRPRNGEARQKDRMFQPVQKQAEHEKQYDESLWNHWDDKNKDRVVPCSATPDYLTNENCGDLKPLCDLRKILDVNSKVCRPQEFRALSAGAVGLLHGISDVTTFQDVVLSLTGKTRNADCILRVYFFLRDLSGSQELGG